MNLARDGKMAVMVMVMVTVMLPYLLQKQL